MFSQQCLEVLYHTATNLPNRLFSSDFVLGNMVETEVRVFKLFPLQPGTQQCSLPGILPVCLCVHTSILARQLPGWGCWKPGQSPQVGLALGSGMWSLHKFWESPIPSFSLNEATKKYAGAEWYHITSASFYNTTQSNIIWYNKHVTIQYILCCNMYIISNYIGFYILACML